MSGRPVTAKCGRKSRRS